MRTTALEKQHNGLPQAVLLLFPEGTVAEQYTFAYARQFNLSAMLRDKQCMRLQRC